MSCVCGTRRSDRILLVHEVKALIREQRSEAFSQVVVGVLCKSHLLHSGQLAIAGPNLLAGRPQILQTAHKSSDSLLLVQAEMDMRYFHFGKWYLSTTGNIHGYKPALSTFQELVKTVG